MLAVALSLLLASTMMVKADHNEVALGSALDYSVNKDSSTCAVKFTVPASVVKPGCKIRVRYDIGAAEARQPTVSFFLKKDVSFVACLLLLCPSDHADRRWLRHKKKKKKKKKKFTEREKKRKIGFFFF
jgi:hypothetical protein